MCIHHFTLSIRSSDCQMGGYTISTSHIHSNALGQEVRRSAPSRNAMDMLAAAVAAAPAAEQRTGVSKHWQWSAVLMCIRFAVLTLCSSKL
jgi:membrane-associated phospholipid phosphatase